MNAMDQIKSKAGPAKQPWEFWIDRGGTFTDIVARKPDGSISTHKLLSVNPEQYDDAAIAGIRYFLDLSANQPIPENTIAAVKMGTTVATNALLERAGEPTALLITQGFKDALRIGYQARPDLFSLDITLPDMLYQSVIEVKERLSASGEVLLELDVTAAKTQMQRLFDQGICSVAIVLMHAYRYPQHEQKLAQIASQIGFTQISVSHRVSPLIKLVSRGDTTVVDAYLTPILRRYVDLVSNELKAMVKTGGQLKFMQSSGGLTDAQLFKGKDAILSGPAGGVVGMVRTAARAGFSKLIGFDMGGTSTDVSHFDGEFERALETEVAGVRMRAPMMQIHTVAAGGGSLLTFDGARYRVGPESAGAYPGPVAYRNGGTLTVTDCNVMLGKLQPSAFPKVFGSNADEALDEVAVSAQFNQLAQRIEQATDVQTTAVEIASGYLAIAIESMANAIKKISVQRGYDVSNYALCCFGGAGGQHACLVADALGMKQIFIHPYAGVLSAYGMGLADTTANRQKSVERELNEGLIKQLEALGVELQAQGEAELQKQNIDVDQARAVWKLQVRYQGSDTSILCPYAKPEAIRLSFEALHLQQFGFISPEKPLVIGSLEVELIFSVQQAGLDTGIKSQQADANQSVNPKQHRVYMADQWHDCAFIKREHLAAESITNGPAVIIESTGTIVVEPGWQAKITECGDLIMHRYQALAQQHAIGTAVDPVMLEIFNNLFMSIAEQMGFVLANTASSVNIKERLDFSCAIFDDQGALVANAPHMPVHLGSMGESIKTVINSTQTLKAGDAIVLNAPYNGGTHLPDITVIKPVFDSLGETILFYVASRGHHADIGGKTPGSAPADSRHIDEEGVVIDNLKLVDQGRFLETEIRNHLLNARWPARQPDTNIADLKAQLAACEKGAQELSKVVAKYSLDVVQAYMRHVQDNAEESVRRVLDTLNDGEFCYQMDDGNQIKVSIKIDKPNRVATIDFTGTSDQHQHNFNAPSAITKAAVLYVFRCMVDDMIPLNEGCLKPLKLIIPPKSIINPEYPAAVIAGNVETSQYIVDTLLGALNCVAASQGTMNNFFWGNDNYQYYETICGGAGASSKKAGADAVQTHMTNSRLTDPEVMEQRFPVLLDAFTIRDNSGGLGLHKGGNGVVRKITFLEPMTATLLTGHRIIPPYGSAGGQSGKTGINQLKRAGHDWETLASTAEVALNVGDSIRVKTPGGGGYGKSKPD